MHIKSTQECIYIRGAYMLSTGDKPETRTKKYIHTRDEHA